MQSCFGKGIRGIVLLAALISVQHSQGVQQLTQHVPRAAIPSTATGRLPAAKQLHLSVGLPLRNAVQLTNLLHDLYEPASPNYRKFLTPLEFTSRFGPSDQDYQALANYFSAQGFTIRATHPNRVLLELVGSVGVIEKTLHVTMREYRHPFEARNFFAPDREPRLDVDVPVLHISGLNDFMLPHPASLHLQPLGKDNGPVPNGGSGPGGLYMGKDFPAAYAPGVALNGAGQYVGLLQFDGYYPSDIASYASRASLTNVPLITVLLDGVDGSPGKANIEVALDIEMCMSMAPALAGIIVYEGLDGNDILNRMANDNLAKQLSASWTFPTDATTETIFQQMMAQGQSYFNASGDGGAYTGTVSTPADSVSVTSVGGTTLTTRGPGQAWVSEKAWNWANTGQGTQATAGGVSTVVPIPVWQQGIDMTASQGSTTMRNVPDVSMVGDQVFVICDNGQQVSAAGTSVGAPLWAAFTALVNQQAAFSGLPPVGFLNPAVYSLGTSGSYTSVFHDVTTGNNTNAASPTRFYAVAGYDLCTGWGSPTGRSLIDALAPPLSVPSIVALAPNIVQETCTPANNAPDPGEVVTVSFPLQNIGGVNTTNLSATLLSSNNVVPISAPQSYGALAGGGGIATRQFTFIANGACGTTVNPVLHLQDGSTDLGTVTFNMQMGAPLVLYAQNFDSVATPMLPSGWTIARSPGATNWATSSALHDSGANAAFAYEPTNAGYSDLISPSVTVSSSSAQLVFRNYFNTEAFPDNTTSAYDGGVLEISIAGGAYADILAAGGTFVSGGYTRTIDTTENPLNGRSAWAGVSGGFVTTVINLPAAAAGQPVRFKWRFGFDNGNAYGSGGWYVDSVSVRDGYTCCNASANSDLAVTGSIFPNPGRIGQNLAYTFIVSSLGPGPAVNVKLTDALPAQTALVSASPGYTSNAGTISWNLGLMPQGALTNLLLILSPAGEGSYTNIVALSSDSTDADPSNNSITSITPVLAPPSIITQPSNQVAVAGSDVTLSVTAAGTGPLAFQWRFNSIDLAGQTLSSLSLPQVSGGNMGQYSVAITNAAGSITSAPVSLRVLVPVQLSAAGLALTATNVALSVNSVQGLIYTLEYKNSLADPAWIPLPGTVPGTGGPIRLNDNNSPSVPARFYRVRTE